MRDFSRDRSALALNTATLGHNVDGHGAGWPPERVIDACAERGFGGLVFWRREIGVRAVEIGERARSAGLAVAGLCRTPFLVGPQAPRPLSRLMDDVHASIDMAAGLGAPVLTIVVGGVEGGTRGVSESLKRAGERVAAVASYAAERGVTLILENHYKDDFWEYPEFAQKMDLFARLVDSLHHPNFGVNYDPSNTYLAGEDPMDLLRLVSHRVVTMHASDRYLIQGTLDDLRKEEAGVTGYAARLRHGEIGKGLNDYDAIFTELRRVGFDGWISIEDGVEGMPQLERSVTFLRRKIKEYWP